MKIDKIFVTDFDGTLSGKNGAISLNSLQALTRLGEIGVVRVIATGRSLFSMQTIVGDELPVDYIVFSSGIGIYDWNKKILLQENKIGEEDTKAIYDYLIEQNYDFMVQLPVPNNHFFHHFSTGVHNKDFFSRLSYYESFGVNPIDKCPVEASQFVIICPEEKDSLAIISNQFNHLKVIKATSPIDGKSIWIEILPYGVSKSFGIEYLRKKLKVQKSNIVTVGNDYYDLDMLRYSNLKNSFIVANAPKELILEFCKISSNIDDGVAKLINDLYF
jgi:hydroxymethylpyrimidine pyrophosphatase-like HAD family hydrolase